MESCQFIELNTHLSKFEVSTVEGRRWRLQHIRNFEGSQHTLREGTVSCQFVPITSWLGFLHHFHISFVHSQFETGSKGRVSHPSPHLQVITS